MNQLSKDEVITLVRLLEKCAPGDLDPEVFVALARLTVSPAIEIVPLRKRNGSIEVLLTERLANDPIWPSMLHTTGTVIRITDSSLADGFRRIFVEELGMESPLQPTFFNVSFGHGARGPGLGIEYWVELNENPKMGTFYDVNNLPDNFIEEQKDLLQRAVKAFTES